MDNKYLGNVVAEMKPFLDENGFKAEGEGVFVGETKKVVVEYKEERQMFTLSLAQRDEDEFGDLVEVNAWLFDDSQNERDAESVGIDFVDTLRKSLGLKAGKVKVGGIELPTASKTGALTVSGFARKALDVYPKYKDAYKEHIEKYGNFLYMNFFAETIIPEMVESVKSSNGKTRKKVYDLCENAYLKGDRETVNLVVACLATACVRDEQAKGIILEFLKHDTHLKSCVEAFIPQLENKKLRAALIK